MRKLILYLDYTRKVKCLEGEVWDCRQKGE